MMASGRSSSGHSPEQNTRVSLREYIEARLSAHGELHEAHEKAHEREHEFSQKAIDTSAELARSNKADSNEWRASMTDREARFSTKEEISALAHRLDQLEDAALVRVERERLQLITAAEETRQSERRVARAQWQIGIIVGVVAAGVAVLVNLVIRLASS
jgi:hypothetical protein